MFLFSYFCYVDLSRILCRNPDKEITGLTLNSPADCFPPGFSAGSEEKTALLSAERLNSLILLVFFWTLVLKSFNLWFKVKIRALQLSLSLAQPTHRKQPLQLSQENTKQYRFRSGLSK